MKLNEIWKPVVGFEELYEVSNLGRVKALKRKKMIAYIDNLEERITKLEQKISNMEYRL